MKTVKQLAKKVINKVVSKKEDGGKEVILELLLTVVGVGLCWVFREQLTSFVKSIMTFVETTIKGWTIGA